MACVFFSLSFSLGFSKAVLANNFSINMALPTNFYIAVFQAVCVLPFITFLLRKKKRSVVVDTGLMQEDRSERLHMYAVWPLCVLSHFCFVLNSIYHLVQITTFNMICTYVPCTSSVDQHKGGFCTIWQWGYSTYDTEPLQTPESFLAVQQQLDYHAGNMLEYFSFCFLRSSMC